MVLIISRESKVIAEQIMNKINRGVTFLHGRGAYSGRDHDIILSVVNNYQFKRLEEVVFNLDPEAFLITKNTFNVLGRGFSHRKDRYAEKNTFDHMLLCFMVLYVGTGRISSGLLSC